MGSAENSGDTGLRGQSLTGSPGNRVPAFAMDSCLIWEVLILHLHLIFVCLLYGSGYEIQGLVHANKCSTTELYPSPEKY